MERVGSGQGAARLGMEPPVAQPGDWVPPPIFMRNYQIPFDMPPIFKLSAVVLAPFIENRYIASIGSPWTVEEWRGSGS